MHRILIADDEALEREVVRFLINQNNWSLDVYEAVNGQEAYSLLEQKKFDILLTDIRMPFVDGFELSRQALNLYPDIQIIFFTGYDDFSYIKEALSLRIVNYILKPIDSMEFAKTMQEVLEQIYICENKELEKKLTMNTMLNHALYQLINGTAIHKLVSSFPQFDLSFTWDFHRLLLIQSEHEYFGTESDDSIFDYFQQLLPPDSFYINLNPTQNVILFAGKQHSLSWYQDLSNTIAEQLKRKLHMNCYIALSDSFDNPDLISVAYEKAEKQIMEQLFFTTTSNIPLHPEEVELNTEDVLMKQLQMDIQFKDSVNLQNHMNALIQIQKNTKKQSHIYFRFWATNVLTLLLDGLSLNTEDSINDYAKIIYYSDHISKIENLLLQLTSQLVTKWSQEKESPKYALQLVKQYIHKHYAEDLSLNILAKEVYLTPKYLSALFIEENKCGINKYIKKVRMEKAQDLLINTNMKVCDICQKVGYVNLSYFCKSFAEEFGTTPDKLRNQKADLKEKN